MVSVVLKRRRVCAPWVGWLIRAPGLDLFIVDRFGCVIAATASTTCQTATEKSDEYPKK